MSIKKLNILVCALCNVDNNPRPNRILSYLKKNANMSFLGFGSTQTDVIFYKVIQRKSFIFKFLKLFSTFFRLHFLTEKVYFSISKELDVDSYDVVICHDLKLLPFIVKENANYKIIFDAREFYPRQFENDFIWRILVAPFYIYLCKKYLPNVDRCITVSNGLKKAYKENFSIDMALFYSLPSYTNMPVNPCNDIIRIIHHGGISSSRELERVIYAMDHVRVGVTLDLMLVGDKVRLKKLQDLTLIRSNVNVIPPVPFKNIVKTLNKYDIGLVFFPPNTFNLKHCMPNKLFEYVQARIGIIAAPLTDLKEFVTSNHIGVVSSSFESESLADTINQLDINVVNKFKFTADALAYKYSQISNDKKIDQLVKELLSNEHYDINIKDKV